MNTCDNPKPSINCFGEVNQDVTSICKMKLRILRVLSLSGKNTPEFSFFKYDVVNNFIQFFI